MKMGLSEIALLFALIGVVSGLVWSYKIYKTQKLVDSLRVFLIRAFVDLCDLTEEYMFWIKDKNGRYIAYSETLRRILYPNKTKDEIIGKNDLELVKNVKFGEIDNRKIKIFYEGHDLVVNYSDLDEDSVICFLSDLVTIKKRRPARFIEKFDHVLLDVVKYPILFRGKVEFMVGMGYIVTQTAIEEEFNRYIQCGEFLDVLINKVKNTGILIFKHDTDICGVVCGWKKLYDVNKIT